MARCLLGWKKTRRIEGMLGPEWHVMGAMVRGGWTHFWAYCYALNLGTGEIEQFHFNYQTGEREPTKYRHAATPEELKKHRIIHRDRCR